MALIVQKYGGTSVGSPERIRAVARKEGRIEESLGKPAGTRFELQWVTRYAARGGVQHQPQQPALERQPAGPADQHPVGRRLRGLGRRPSLQLPPGRSDLRLGELDLKPGRGNLTLQALEVPGKQVMEVRGVILTLLK